MFELFLKLKGCGKIFIAESPELSHMIRHTSVTVTTEGHATSYERAHYIRMQQENGRR